MFSEGRMKVSEVLKNPKELQDTTVKFECIFSQFCGEDDAYLMPGDEIDTLIDAEELYNAGKAIKVEISKCLAEKICENVHRGTTGISYDFIGFCEIEGTIDNSSGINLVLSYLKLPGNGYECEGDFEYRK